jgi:hypothetical protein
LLSIGISSTGLWLKKKLILIYNEYSIINSRIGNIQYLYLTNSCFLYRLTNYQMLIWLVCLGNIQFVGNLDEEDAPRFDVKCHQANKAII